jgi:hypothetical protein
MGSCKQMITSLSRTTFFREASVSSRPTCSIGTPRMIGHEQATSASAALRCDNDANMLNYSSCLLEPQTPLHILNPRLTAQQLQTPKR